MSSSGGGNLVFRGRFVADNGIIYVGKKTLRDLDGSTVGLANADFHT